MYYLLDSKEVRYNNKTLKQIFLHLEMQILLNQIQLCPVISILCQTIVVITKRNHFIIQHQEKRMQKKDA